MSTSTYVAPEDKRILVEAGATIPDAIAHKYGHGDLVSPEELANATLRDLAVLRVPSGRLSANARKAGHELGRRKVNRLAKRAAKANA